MAFVEDLSVFMDVQTGFAEHIAVDGVAGVGIFEAEWGDALNMGAPRPVLFVVAADFPAADIGDTVTVRGVGYTLVEMRPDAGGISIFVLEGS